MVEGHKISLSCNVSGNPAPDVKWIRDVSVVGVTSQNQSTSADGYFVESRYEINKVTWSIHNQVIVCRGTNSGGMIEKKTQLFVLCKYKIFY